MGQTIYEIERAAPDDVERHSLLRANGVPFTPSEVLEAIKRINP